MSLRSDVLRHRLKSTFRVAGGWRARCACESETPTVGTPKEARALLTDHINDPPPRRV